MRKMPRTIYIGGVPYKVRIQKSIAGHLGKPKDVRIIGQFRPRTHEIIYRAGLREEKNSTIIHEIVHAIAHEFGFDLDEFRVDTLSREISGSLCQMGLLK